DPFHVGQGLEAAGDDAVVGQGGPAEPRPRPPLLRLLGGHLAPEEERRLPGGVPGAVLLQPAGVRLQEDLDRTVELGGGDAAAGEGAVLADDRAPPLVDANPAELADPALQAEDPGELEHAGPGPAGEG